MKLQISGGKGWVYFISDGLKITIARNSFSGFGDASFSWILTKNKNDDVEVIDLDKNGKITKVIK